jgi:hypothetical protein
MGDGAMVANQSGASNVAVGVSALRNNTTGVANVAMGHDALVNNNAGLNTGGANTAVGYQALRANGTGVRCAAFGSLALALATGSANTALGERALSNLTTGGANTAVGVAAGANLGSGNGNIYLGNFGVGTESNTMRLGTPSGFLTNRAFIFGVRGVTTGIADAIPVLIDSAGQLGTANSSRRFKTEIKPIDKTSEAILALKPVTFHYKADTTGTPQFGLIAEEVAEVNPDLVVSDPSGSILTVRYEAVNAMLLNEFLKEHKKVEEQDRKLEDQNRKIEQQDATITQSKKEVETLVARVKEQDSKIQRVSDQVEMGKSAPQVVLNHP